MGNEGVPLEVSTAAKDGDPTVIFPPYSFALRIKTNNSHVNGWDTYYFNLKAIRRRYYGIKNFDGGNEYTSEEDQNVKLVNCNITVLAMNLEAMCNAEEMSVRSKFGDENYEKIIVSLEWSNASLDEVNEYFCCSDTSVEAYTRAIITSDQNVVRWQEDAYIQLNPPQKYIRHNMEVGNRIYQKYTPLTRLFQAFDRVIGPEEEILPYVKEKGPEQTETFEKQPAGFLGLYFVYAGPFTTETLQYEQCNPISLWTTRMTPLYSNIIITVTIFGFIAFYCKLLCYCCKCCPEQEMKLNDAESESEPETGSNPNPNELETHLLESGNRSSSISAHGRHSGGSLSDISTNDMRSTCSCYNM